MMKSGYLGCNIPKFGFGLMRLPQKDGEINMDQCRELIDTYMENGFTYFDTAYVYGGGKSEIVARELIVKRYPRASFQLATKMPMWLVHEKSDLEKIFNEQLAKTGTDYFDFYLLHGINGTVSDRFPSSSLSKADEFDAWGFMQKKKAEGKIKHIGFSFHDTAEVLDGQLARHPEIEFVQLQLNYADWDDAVIQSRLCYETAMKHQKPVIVMEPIKGGTLVKLRPEIQEIFEKADPHASLASWAVRFNASLDGIITVLSGISEMEHLEDHISYMKNFKPLSTAEAAVVEKAAKAFREVETIGCTSCRYCTDGCPQSINIPKIIELINDYKVYSDLEYTKRRYNNVTSTGGKASSCITCSSCEARCPQKLQIMEHMKTAASLFE